MSGGRGEDGGGGGRVSGGTSSSFGMGGWNDKGARGLVDGGTRVAGEEQTSVSSLHLYPLLLSSDNTVSMDLGDYSMPGPCKYIHQPSLRLLAVCSNTSQSMLNLIRLMSAW